MYSRRHRSPLFFALVGIVVLSSLLFGACGPTPTPVVVRETVIVEKVVPQTVMVKETTVVEQTVEVEKVVTPTPQAKGGTLVYGLGFEPATLDPHKAASYDAHLMFMQVYDPLVWLDLDGTYKPGLAESWDAGDGGKVWTFKLRRGVRFHDGTPFNAEAVKFAFERVANPATKSLVARDILGPYDHTEVVDEFTVRVFFQRPYAAFLDAVSQSWLAMVSPAAVQKYGDDYGRNQVGTGPFIWKEYVPKDHLTLERNPDYNWAPTLFQHQGPPYLEKVIIKFVPNEATRASILETGEIQVAEDLPPVEVIRLKNNPAYVLIQGILPGQPTVLFLNTTNTPTQDLAVRRALNYAVDKNALIQTMLRGLSEPALGPLARTTAYYSKAVETMYPYDPEKAKQILDEAGWKVDTATGVRVKEGKPLQVFLNTMPFNRYPEIMQVLQSQWKQVGIDVKINVMPTFAQFNGAAQKGEHSLMPYFTPAADPHFALWPFFHSTNIEGGLAYSRFADAHLDELLDKAAQTVDSQERAALYAEAQQIIMDKALIAPLYLVYNNTMTRAEVKGLRFDKRGWYPWLYDVYIQK